ncbi:unnamed protein product [Rotaria sp. Silwood1]|nr:unnamed protein product [Rotaria sp. Silwood1]
MARTDPRQLIDKPKRQLTRISRDLAYDFKSSMKTDDLSENELIRWIKKLNDLQLEIKSSYSIELIEDQRFPIYPITVTHNKFPNMYRNNPNIKNSFNANSEELFFKTTGPASIENSGIIVKHNGPDLDYGHVLCKQFYSQGRHTIRFKIVQCTLPYIIFFGCISSEVIQQVLNYNSSSVVGWFGYNEIYEHGIWNNNLAIHGYDSNQFQKNDIVNLTFDCDQQEIELFHERTIISCDHNLTNEELLRIPLLKDVFERYPTIPINIDVKENNDELIRQISKLIQEYQREDLTYWGSFNHVICQKLTTENSHIVRFCSLKEAVGITIAYWLGLLPFIPLKPGAFEVPIPGEVSQKAARNLNWKFKMLFYVAERALNNKSMFVHLQRRGIPVYVWILNNEQEFEYAIQHMCVTGIMTDYPSRLRNYLTSKEHEFILN